MLFRAGSGDRTGQAEPLASGTSAQERRPPRPRPVSSARQRIPVADVVPAPTAVKPAIAEPIEGRRLSAVLERIRRSLAAKPRAERRTRYRLTEADVWSQRGPEASMSEAAHIHGRSEDAA